jgi:hypothetical protein
MEKRFDLLRKQKKVVIDDDDELLVYFIDHAPAMATTPSDGLVPERDPRVSYPRLLLDPKCGVVVRDDDALDEVASQCLANLGVEMLQPHWVVVGNEDSCAPDRAEHSPSEPGRQPPIEVLALTLERRLQS